MSSLSPRELILSRSGTIADQQHFCRYGNHRTNSSTERTDVDILTAVKRTVIPKPHDLGFCFFPLRGFAPALTDLLCSGLFFPRSWSE
jgi:hypothetical protein